MGLRSRTTARQTAVKPGTMMRTLLLFCGAIAAAGCDSSNTPTPTTPVATVTETFPGTLRVNGGTTHQFSTSSRGSVSATLTSIAPDAVVGVSLGVWNGITCQVVLANDDTGQGSGVSGTVTGVGNLCLRVYDTGKLTQAVDYVVSVEHP